MELICVNHAISTDMQMKKAYLELRKNIGVYGSEMKIIGFTSCGQSTEKSSVILNFAADLVKERKRVILIDTDMDKAMLTNLVSDRQEEGISNYLTEGDTEEEIIFRTDIENLFIILSGTGLSDTLKIQDTKKLDSLFREMAKFYDYVLVDIPPLDAFDETEAVKACNGMVLVIKANDVSCRLGRKAKIKLELLGCPILGAVFLQVI